MTAISVFCASSSGHDPQFLARATALGDYLARQGITVVYGGARIGLMGAVADGALAAGGRVVGVLPDFLRSREIAHRGLTELIMVDSMHARKTRMHALSDGVIALPGGFGTLEEIFEILTWAQLGLHTQPVGLLNVSGYYDDLLSLLDNMVARGLLRPENRGLLIDRTDAAELLQAMRDYVPAPVTKWLDRDET